MNKDILSNSLSRGIDSDHIVEWLQSHQAPANVIETVKEWIREFFRLFITERMMLVSGEMKVSRQIESYAPLKAYLEIIPAQTVYQVKRGCEEKVKEILSALVSIIVRREKNRWSFHLRHESMPGVSGSYWCKVETGY